MSVESSLTLQAGSVVLSQAVCWVYTVEVRLDLVSISTAVRIVARVSVLVLFDTLRSVFAPVGLILNPLSPWLHAACPIAPCHILSLSTVSMDSPASL